MGFAEVHSIALFQLTRQADIVFDQAGNLFDAYAYSRFKYGSAYMARHYAEQLHLLLQQKHPILAELPALWLTSSAYKFVPTASDSLAKYLLQDWKGNLTKVKIVRSRLFPADYGNLSLQERQAMMQQVELYFDPISPKPKHLLVVDDIRITGVHEQRILEFATKEGFEHIYFAYIAHLSPKADPTTEHWLNHIAIRHLRDLWDLWKTEGCLLNARICKFLLSYPKQKALAHFANALPPSIKARIAEGMYQDGYAEMDMYAENWQIWKQYQPKKELISYE